MPLPKSQLAQLRADLSAHARRIIQLKEQSELIDKEIAVHELIVGLGKSKEMLAKLGELYDHPEMVAAIQGSELRVARRANIELPKGAKVSLTTEGAGTIHIRLEAVHKGLSYTLLWSSERGFSSADRSLPY